MSVCRVTVHSHDEFSRLDALAIQMLSPALLTMYETYRDTLLADKVNAACIVSMLSLFLWETSQQRDNRLLH